ncbi:hypothetical protein M8J76_007448 [Diaphorina citri]|nr:hypothetical protein M8J76_007448 [Diaphorina citri]
MNLNTPLNQHVTYSYNTPSPAPSTTSRRDSFPPPHPLGQNGFDPTGQVKSEYNYYQLSSDEKFEILKSISASFTPGYGGFLPNTPPLGHHYLSPSGLPGKAEYQERPLYPPQGQMYEQSSSDGKDDGQHYQSLDGYGHKAQNAGFAESSTSSVSQGGSQSLAHKLVLAKINGKSKRGRPSKRQEREDEAPVEYRVVKTEPNQTNHPPSETEDSDDPLGESMVVEPEYTPVTQIGGNAGLEFNR